MAGYINGDAVEFTGEVRQLHGGEFRVFRWLEGVKVGQEGVTRTEGQTGSHEQAGRDHRGRVRHGYGVSPGLQPRAYLVARWRAVCRRAVHE
jgi:hypothetical protein